MDGIEKDQKLFVRAFAEPTEIYRRLAEHRQKHPLQLFLHRNLSYVRFRKWRPKKVRRRSSGKMNSLSLTADKLMEQKRGVKHYMTITFYGFYCGDVTESSRFAEVQMIHKETDTILTSVVVELNPQESAANGPPIISLPTESLQLTSADGRLMDVASCVVQFKVTLLNDRFTNEKFVSELQLYNSVANGLISSGNYGVEFGKNDEFPKQISPSKRTPSWKSRFVRDQGDLVDAEKAPVLKFNLEWSKQLFIEENGCADGKPLMAITANMAARRAFTRSRSTGSILSRSSSFTRANENVQCLVYQFIHNNIRQKTEVWDRLKCPWCVHKSNSLYRLLKHLSLCHDRFKFKYAPTTNEIRIDVMVNKRTENIQNDPFSRYGTKFDGTWPVKRQPRTAIHVFRPERYRPRLAEFMWNFDGNLFGRKRTYYHSYSGLVVRPSEIDENSEDEMDPLWLRQNVVRLIDDFVDVNVGEKEIMKLWNLHVLANNYVCDGQMGAAILLFVRTHGEHILRNHLYRNCLVHIANLSDYRLITATDAYKAIAHLQSILTDNSAVRKIVANRLKEQRKYATQPKRRVAVASRTTTTTQMRKQTLTETPRRKMDQILMRKRLRSHSLLANIRDAAGQRAHDNKENMERVMRTRGARKSAPYFNANSQ